MSRDYFGLSGKIALVTGASGGLGAHFAKVFAAEGATVVLTARRKDKLKSEVQSIRDAGGLAEAMPMDVTVPESVSETLRSIEQKYGRLDILINNAGVASDPKKFLDTNEEDWNWVVETNLNGAWRVAKSATELMVNAGNGGSIINIASVYGLRTGAMKVAYNASKAGVVQLTKSMAIELCRNNIRVNALCPGWFETDMNRSYFESDAGKRYVDRIPLKQLGQMDDLTVPCLMLASDSAGRYITGSCVSVDGGIGETPI